MSIYYIETIDGQVYHLDATTDISKTVSGKITDNPVESGDILSDHYVHIPDSFSLSGKISDFKSSTGSAKSPKEYIEELSAVKRNKQQFKFYFGGKVAVSLNCMFTNLKITQSKDAGHNGPTGADTFIIQAQIRQIDFAESAAITVERDFEFKDKFSTEQDSAKTTEATSLDGLAGADATAEEIRALLGEVITGNLRPPVVSPPSTGI